MSGVELIAAVGVVASAAQLIAYSLKVIEKISELYSRVKDAPKRIVHYTTQINQLIAACRTIQEYKTLDSPLVDDQLRSTFGELKHLTQALTRVRRDSACSRSKRVWKTIVSNKERSVVACFERLEREKTALILCINVVNIQTLGNIGSSVDILIDRGMPSPFPDFINTLSTGDKDREAQIRGPTLTSTSTTMRETSLVPVGVYDSRVGRIQPDSESGPSSHGNAQDDRPGPCVRLGASWKRENKLEGHQARKQQTFKDMTSCKNATQYNGDQNLSVNAAHSYKRSISDGHSFQHNGNRKCKGGTGAHKHRKGLATGNSIQCNGNIGGGITDSQIRKNAGKKLERESSNGVRLDVRFLEDEGSEEYSENESDADDSY